MNETDQKDDALRTSVLAAELHEVIGKLKRRLREQAGAGDMPQSQIAVLGQLERNGPATVTALARTLGMRPQSMGATIAALQAAGKVEGSPDPTDGRQTILSLTPSCKAWIRDGRAARHDWIQRTIEAELTSSEQEQIMTAVRLLNRLVKP